MARGPRRGDERGESRFAVVVGPYRNKPKETRRFKPPAAANRGCVKLYAVLSVLLALERDADSCPDRVGRRRGDSNFKLIISIGVNIPGPDLLNRPKRHFH